jgi:hypothetical protein
MRTYSHAILTYAAIRIAKHGSPKKAARDAAVGATLPDIPVALGVAWLWTKRKTFSRNDFDDEVCGRSFFREPDAAFHSALVAASAIVLERSLWQKNSAFTLGWAGHVIADFLTHGSDARPVLWPLSEGRFQSPVSYREKERYGKIFTSFEHAAVFAVVILLLLEARRSV